MLNVSPTHSIPSEWDFLLCPIMSYIWKESRENTKKRIKALLLH